MAKVLAFVLLLAIFTVCVNSKRYGGHHKGEHGDDSGHYPPPPNGPEYTKPSELEDKSEDEDKDDDGLGSSLPYVIGLALSGVALLVISTGFIVYVVKKNKRINTVASDSRKTPVVSIIKVPPPPYEPSKTTPRARLSEATAPPAEPPAYSFIPPTTPPPPYEIKDKDNL